MLPGSKEKGAGQRVAVQRVALGDLDVPQRCVGTGDFKKTGVFGKAEVQDAVAALRGPDKAVHIFQEVRTLNRQQVLLMAGGVPASGHSAVCLGNRPCRALVAQRPDVVTFLSAR